MMPKLPFCLDIDNANLMESRSISIQDQEWGLFCDDNGRVIAQCMSKVAEGLQLIEDENSSGDEDISSLDDIDEELAWNEIISDKGDKPEMVLLVSTDLDDAQLKTTSPGSSQSSQEMFSSDLDTNYCTTRTWVEKQEDIGQSILSQQNLEYGLSDENQHSLPNSFLNPILDREKRGNVEDSEKFPCIKSEWYIRKPANDSILNDDVTIVNTDILATDTRNFLKKNDISLNTFAKQHLHRSQGTLSDLLNHPKQWDELSNKGKDIYISLMKFLSSPNLQSLVSGMARRHVRSNGKCLPDCIMKLLERGVMPHDEILSSYAFRLNLNYLYLRHHCSEQIKLYNDTQAEGKDVPEVDESMFIKIDTEPQEIADNNINTQNDILPKFLEQHICTHFGCGAILQNKPCLKNHLKCHAGKKQHLCVICNERFSTKYNLNCHINTHSGPSKISQKARERLSKSNVDDQTCRYVCGLCWTRCKTRHYLIKHLLQHGIAKQNVVGFTCYVCAKNFTTYYGLKIHMRIHSNTRPFQCEQCDMGFQTKANLQRHIRRHTGEKPYVCPLCPARFTEAKCVTVHMRTHTGEKPFACPICHKRFAQNYSMQSHILIHKNEKPHLCELCGTSFRQKSNLRMHMLRHRGVKNRKCQICGMSFLTKSDFDRHYLKHTGERLFQCEHCLKSFTRLAYLQEHLKKLQGLHAPQCMTCHKKFCDENSRKKHIKLHHDVIENELVKQQNLVSEMQKPPSLDSQVNTNTLFLASKALFNDEKHYILTAVRPMDNQANKSLIDNSDAEHQQPNNENLHSFVLTPADDLTSTFPAPEHSILMHLCQDFSLSETENRVLPGHILLTSDGSILSNTRQSHIPISLAPVDEDNIKGQQNMVENSDPNMQSVVVETTEDSMIISRSHAHETDINHHVKLNDAIGPCQVVVPTASSSVGGIVIPEMEDRPHVEMCSGAISSNSVNTSMSNESVILSHPIEDGDQTNELSKNQTYIIVDMELET